MERLAMVLLIGVAVACSELASPADAVRRLVDADNRCDLATVLASYADDAVWHPPEGGEVVGKAALRARYEDRFARFAPDLRVEIIEELSGPAGDVVSGIVTGELECRADGAGKLVDDEFVATLVQGADGWRVQRLRWWPRAGARRPN